jgi:hypothetical protein
MTAAVLTPFTAGEAVELGNRLWRKRVLPVGDVEYKGRTLHFDRDYLGRLVSAFKDRAYDQVPFQLADSQNTHTNDPERTRGEITAMELGDDGLWITAQLTEDGEKVLAANPRLGVSARIVEDYQRSDGKFFSRAVQHVLGTLDPRIPGLGAWEAIEAASPVPDKVFDLTAESFTDLATPKEQRKAEKAQRRAAKAAAKQTDTASETAGADPEGGAAMADLGNLTDEQRERLAKLLDLPDDTLDALAAGGSVLTADELDALTAPDGGGDGELSDAELDELVAAAQEMGAAGLLEDEEGATADPGYAPEQEREPVAAGLAADEYAFEINLANARAEETQRELAMIQARLKEQDFLAERDRLFHNFGVPPYVTDLARPLLEGAGHVVEMANGKSVDAGQVVRKVMAEMAELGGLRDLGGTELGTRMDEPEGVRQEEAEQSRQALVTNFKSMTGLK